MVLVGWTPDLQWNHLGQASLSPWILCERVEPSGTASRYLQKRGLSVEPRSQHLAHLSLRRLRLRRPRLQPALHGATRAAGVRQLCPAQLHIRALQTRVRWCPGAGLVHGGGGRVSAACCLAGGGAVHPASSGCRALGLRRR